MYPEVVAWVRKPCKPLMQRERERERERVSRSDAFTRVYSACRFTIDQNRVRDSSNAFHNQSTDLL